MESILAVAEGVATVTGFDVGSSSNALGKKTDKTYVATDVLMVTSAQKQPYAVLVVDPTKCKRGKTRVWKSGRSVAETRTISVFWVMAALSCR